MTEAEAHPEPIFSPEDLQSAWGLPVSVTVCDSCGWNYVVPSEVLPQKCPHCFQADLDVVVGDLEKLARIKPPELVIPYSISQERLVGSIQAFSKGGWFAPADFTPANLMKRLRRIYMPMWLVDGSVEATWQAETGFNYQVVSHQDHYDDRRRGWVSREVQETRVRWEPRLGRLQRSYQNIAAPALEEQKRMLHNLGNFDLEHACSYNADALQQAYVRLPNREPGDAWSDAEPAFSTAGADEVRRAAQADFIREFRWSAEYSEENWTLLLLPVLLTYYLDDEKQPQRILVHGETGKLAGRRRASMQRAQRTAVLLLAAGVVLFLLSLAAGALSFVAPPVAVIAGIGFLAALLVSLSAVAPLVIAWQVNRQPYQPEI